ncbi:hypothetical protein F3Y22_tig00116951pilonHSYRG00892 [Hibiscus syriacus]|uniref:Uncharacterized protein n=1 Tax=Hibiscus syriacus TaxID=106335 RepID=A0A6A2X186_HIBSY|nr:uncharacterized protein LOC120188832 [Hibiscus syriacus]KAE8660815.1 hypothetical protein F3Y22_tig00116951pilonHSYRG00892 [Hibiscus syriacus]
MAAAQIDVDTAMTDDTTSNSLVRNTRCCFCFPCFSYRRTPSVGIAFWQRISSTSSQVQPGTGFWIRSFTVFQKVREWSEIVAGPRWKNFIRRFNRNKSGSGGRHGQFRYDPLSYALNFDEGQGQIGDSEDVDNVYGGFRSFSVRYASVSLGSEKTALAYRSQTE